MEISAAEAQVSSVRHCSLVLRFFPSLSAHRISPNAPVRVFRPPMPVFSPESPMVVTAAGRLQVPPQDRGIRGGRPQPDQAASVIAEVVVHASVRMESSSAITVI